MSSNAAVSMLRSQLQTGHEWLTGTMQGLDEEQLHWLPSGRAGSIGAEFAHTVMGEDFMLSTALGGTPLLMSSHAGKTGVSEPPPQGAWGEWGRSVRVDLDQMNEYAQAVYAASDAYLARLSDADLDREMDLSEMGFGTMTLGAFLNIASAHVYMHMGEISNMKGAQGLQGYPF